MSNQIGYVLVIASANYKQPIFSVLRQEDIAYQDPLSENENFLEYIKKNNARISDYDAVIIDLGAVSDSDADIMTALETIRFVDDHRLPAGTQWSFRSGQGWPPAQPRRTSPANGGTCLRFPFVP